MGGEQYAVLMYGPEKSRTVSDWVEAFQLVNKKQWVKNFLENEEHDYEVGYDTEDEEGIGIVFEQEFEDSGAAHKILDQFLEKANLTMAFDNNCCWDEPYIGMRVETYASFPEAAQEQVKSFCEQYQLGDPTFFAGIQGEFE